jgi:hypothetical protein
MDGENKTSPETVELSRAEVLAVLNVMEARFIPGLEPAPGSEQASDLSTSDPVEGFQSLQARGLAQSDAEGRWLVHRLLLTLVGTCAYSHSAVLAYHWPVGQETPTSLFGHIRDDDAVMHTPSGTGLHTFALLSSKEALVDLALEKCGFNLEGGARVQVLILRDAFNRARELASQGQNTDAARMLRSAKVSADAAEGLSGALSASPLISAFQVLKHQGESIRTREFTLINNDGGAWLVMPTGVNPDSPLLAKGIGRNELGALLSGWL